MVERKPSAILSMWGGVPLLFMSLKKIHPLCEIPVE